MSPAPAVSNANEDVGQRRDVRQGVVTPPLSDILPAGHTVVPPKVMLQHGGITTFSDTRSHRITVRVSEEAYDAFKRRATALNASSPSTYSATLTPTVTIALRCAHGEGRNTNACG